MKNAPFFSIVIPVLNEEECLPLLLTDLIHQTTSNFEVIVVDGQSTDQTLPKINKLKAKLPKLSILTSKIRSVSVQRNLGALAASGQYIIFMDADNRVPDYYLEGVKYRVHTTSPDIFTTWCSPDSTDPQDKAISTIINVGIEGSTYTEMPYAQGSMIGCTPSAFKKIGGFDQKIHFAEDAAFVTTGYKAGLSYLVYHDPRYVLSLRRFRRIGRLRMFQKYAVLHLKYLTQKNVDIEKEYPMGGSAFSADESAQSFFDSIQSSLKSFTKNQKIIQKLRSIIISLED